MTEKYNIKVQYAAWIAVATLGTVVVLTGIHVWREIETKNVALRLRAAIEAKTVAKAVQPALVATNKNALHGLLQMAISDDEILYARVLDAQGVQLYSLGGDLVLPESITVREAVMEGKKQIGEVELGFRDAAMSRYLLQVIGIDFGLGALLLALFVAGSFWVSAPVRDALADLLAYVKQVRAGEAQGEPLNSDLAEVDKVGKELSDLMAHVNDAQRRLARAQKELKAAQKEMDEYTYVISHDLKEPLRGIEGFSKFLSEQYRDKLDDDGRHFIDRIRSSALRMQNLINDLLKFSRMSQQRKPMDSVGLNTMLMHVRANLQFALDAKKADLRVDKLPMVVCDPTALTEVFHNLISNAIKYNDKPHPVVEVGCTEKNNPETGQPEYEFFVRDNGVGIKAEYFDKIFQIFQRLHRDDEGTGIGLTIVRRVIEWHGGRIWPESTEGQGTTFYFTLPKREGTKSSTSIEAPTFDTKGTTKLAPTV